MIATKVFNRKRRTESVFVGILVVLVALAINSLIKHQTTYDILVIVSSWIYSKRFFWIDVLYDGACEYFILTTAEWCECTIVQFGKNFLKAIQDTQLYMLILPVVNDTVGKIYEILAAFVNKGIGAVLSTFGVVSFAVTFINAARTRMVRGIIFEDIIICYFPFYNEVFLFNGLFVLLGTYCTAVEAALSEVLCLIGLGLCLLYMLRMTYYVALNEKNTHHLASKYIKNVSEYYVKKKDLNVSKIIRFETSVCSDLSCRIQSNSFSEDGREIRQDLEYVLQIMPTIYNSTESEPYAEAYNVIQSLGFHKIKKQKGEDEILHIKRFLARVHKDAESRRFEQEVILTYEVIRCLLSEVTDDQRKAKIVMQLISLENEKKLGFSVSLCCGLVLYLCNHYMPAARLTTSKEWEQCIDFIHYMYQTARESSPVVMDSFPSMESECWMHCFDVAMIILCIAAIEQCNTKEIISIGPTLQIVTDIIQEERKRYNVIKINNYQIEEYLCLAYFVYQWVPAAVLKTPSRRERIRANCEIIKHLKSNLNV